MPRREPSAYVWDIRDACQRLKEGLGGVDKATYLADTMHRLAVERVLIVIGEAMSQLAKLDAALANELGRLRLWLSGTSWCTATSRWITSRYGKY